MTAPAAAFALPHHANHINGQWRSAACARVFDVADPASGRLLAQVPDSGADDARAALDAACAAFGAWRAQPAKKRAAVLLRWHALVQENAAALGALLSAEQGKPQAEATGEVLYGASYIEWFAHQAQRLNGEVLPATAADRRMLTVREPVGVVAAVTPWNFPSAMLSRKVAPALAAGCTVVCKPAEDTPLSALALVELAQRAGLPAGALNIVTASRQRAAEVVDVWLDDARVRKLSFTGSTAVGRHLAERSAATLKRVSLELGGNAPFIVFDDADVDAAVRGLVAAKFRNAGQVCISPNRVFAQEGIHDEFVARTARAVAALKVGPASAADAQIGPLINARAVEKVERHVQNAVAQGATLHTGGVRLPHLGENFFAPTVLAGVTGGMDCSCEETFGPVAAIARFRDEAEVVAAANATPFGLAGYFYSRDMARIWRVADALECGMVGINESALSSEAMPFGGVKASGYGREGSVHGLDDYVQIKYLCMGGLG